MPPKRQKSRAIAKRDKEIASLKQSLEDSEARVKALLNGQQRLRDETASLQEVVTALGRALFFSTQNQEARLTFSIAVRNIEKSHGSDLVVAKALESLGIAAATYREREQLESPS